MILRVWGEEIPAKAWSEIIGSYSVAGSSFSCLLPSSLSSHPSKGGASSDEL